MAKFCTKCGKKLEDGQVCDCSKEVTTETVKTGNGFDINEIVNSYVEMVKGIFVKPVDTIKKFATSNNFVLGLISLALNCIVCGIFAYCVASEMVSLLSSFMGLGSYESFGIVTSSIEIPFLKTFFYSFLYTAVNYIVLIAMIYVMASVVFKAKTDFKKIFSLIGVCSVFTTITTVAAIILNYISVKLMIVVLLVASMFYLVYVYQGIGETTDVDKNKLAYVFVPALSVATFVVLYILPKLL